MDWVCVIPFIITCRIENPGAAVAIQSKNKQTCKSSSFSQYLSKFFEPFFLNVRGTFVSSSLLYLPPGPFQ